MFRRSPDRSENAIYGTRDSSKTAGQTIEDHLQRCGLAVARQSYPAEGLTDANIETERIGKQRPGEIILVGAHYDSVIGSPGANDNGSGVAALLEIAAMIAARNLSRSLRLVAFVNEEPPFFMTPLTGSRVYARHARRAGDHIIAMFSLETIGYYDDRSGSQR
jgi:Zn-dependent M28 family amino/carboxypeptidase